MTPTLLESVATTVTTQVRRNRYDLTPMVRVDRIDETLTTLLQAVESCRIPRGPKFIRFEAMNADGPVESSLRTVARDSRIRLYDVARWTRPVALRREGGIDRSQDGWNRDVERQILHQKRRLGEHLNGEVQLVDRSDDPTAIEEFFRMERSGYKFATGVATESWDGEAQWFRATCDEFRRSGRLVVCTLEVSGAAIAIMVFFRSGDRLLGIERAYDEEFKHFSPGYQLDLEFLDYFHAQDDVQMIDSCTGASKEKSLLFYLESRRAVTVTAAVAGRRYGWLLTAFGFVRDRLRLKSRLLGLLHGLPWLDRLARTVASRSSKASTRPRSSLGEPE
jgi:hypothetical protein